MCPRYTNCWTVFAFYRVVSTEPSGYLKFVASSQIKLEGNTKLAEAVDRVAVSVRTRNSNPLNVCEDTSKHSAYFDDITYLVSALACGCPVF